MSGVSDVCDGDMLCDERQLETRWGGPLAAAHLRTVMCSLPTDATTHALAAAAAARPPANQQHPPQLRKSLEALFAQPGAVLPTKARFFRGAMSTIISRALGDLDIKPLPSRRCFSIMSEWLLSGGPGLRGGAATNMALGHRKMHTG